MQSTNQIVKKALPTLPMEIVNYITKLASEINDDDFVIKFCEVGKINKTTKRLCLCAHCKIRTKMCIVLNKEKFELKLTNFYNIKSTYKMQPFYLENSIYQGNMVCIKTTLINYPGWAREPDRVKKYETFLLSYKSTYKTKYILLKDVYTSLHTAGLKTGIDGSIYDPTQNSTEFINNIRFNNNVLFLDNIQMF
jgi:hypothetical protein